MGGREEGVPDAYFNLHDCREFAARRYSRRQGANIRRRPKLQARRGSDCRALGRPVNKKLHERLKEGASAVVEPMVKVLWFQQGGVHPAGKHRRHTELCQSLDVPAVGEVGSLTIPVLTLRSRIVIRIRVAPW